MKKPRNVRKRTSSADVAEWKQERAAGRQTREIAERHGVDESLIRYHLDGKGKRAAASSVPAPTPAAAPVPVAEDEAIDESPMTSGEFAAYLAGELRTQQRAAKRYNAAGDTISAQRAAKTAASLAGLLAKQQARDDGNGDAVKVPLADLQAARERNRAKVHDLISRFLEELR